MAGLNDLVQDILLAPADPRQLKGMQDRLVTRSMDDVANTLGVAPSSLYTDLGKSLGSYGLYQASQAGRHAIATGYHYVDSYKSPLQQLILQNKKDTANEHGITFGGKTTPQFRKAMIETYGALPENVRTFLHQRGASVAVGGIQADITPKKYWSSYSEPTPEDSRIHTNQSNGVYYHQERLITVAQKEYRNDAAPTIGEGDSAKGVLAKEWKIINSAISRGVLRHETGHGVDHALNGVSQSPGFREAHQRDVVALGGHEVARRRGIGYYTYESDPIRGRMEAFAELWAAHNGGGCRGLSLPNYFPASAAWIADFQKKFDHAFTQGPDAVGKLLSDTHQRPTPPSPTHPPTDAGSEATPASLREGHATIARETSGIDLKTSSQGSSLRGNFLGIAASAAVVGVGTFIATGDQAQAANATFDAVGGESVRRIAKGDYKSAATSAAETFVPGASQFIEGGKDTLNKLHAGDYTGAVATATSAATLGTAFATMTIAGGSVGTSVGTVVGGWVGGGIGLVAGGAIGSIVPVAGTATGAVAGEVTGAATGAWAGGIVGGVAGSIAGSQIASTIYDHSANAGAWVIGHAEDTAQIAKSGASEAWAWTSNSASQTWDWARGVPPKDQAPPMAVRADNIKAVEDIGLKQTLQTDAAPHLENELQRYGSRADKRGGRVSGMKVQSSITAQTEKMDLHTQTQTPRSPDNTASTVHHHMSSQHKMARHSALTPTH